jgi:leader peptidase (prepilin peptidase) / N-methyltransferase
MDPLEIALLVVVSGLGLLLGSFGNAAIHRIPREIPLGLFSHTRSKCPKCANLIRAKHNIPLLSYFLLQGRCADCREDISVRYPVVEFLSTLLFFGATFIFIRFRGFSWGYDALGPELLFLGLQIYFLWSLLVVTYIDIDFRIIPDRFSLGNWGLAAAAALYFDDPGLWPALFGGLLGFGMFFLLAWGYEKLKGVEGLGFGDVKMIGWLGTWLGLEWVPFIIFVGSVSGLVVGLIQMRKSQEGLQSALPFGPFLAFAALVAWCLKFTAFSVGTLVF